LPFAFESSTALDALHARQIAMGVVAGIVLEAHIVALVR
jgi:hypothetical protein